MGGTDVFTFNLKLFNDLRNNHFRFAEWNAVGS